MLHRQVGMSGGRCNRVLKSTGRRIVSPTSCRFVIARAQLTKGNRASCAQQRKQLLLPGC